MKKIYSLALAAFFALGAHAQIHYSEDFESGNGANWKYTDLDGDGRNFAISNASTLYTGIGTKSLTSYSWYNTVLTPNNLVSSLPITIPSGYSSLLLSYTVASQANSYGAEHYAVYVTPTNDATAILATTPLLEETLPFTGGLDERTIDLSAYAGQTVYLSFRHFDCVDQYILIFDNLKIETRANNNAKLISGQINKYVLANTQNDITFKVKNTGGNAITSVELNWNDGSDHISTITTSIQPGATQEIVHPVKAIYSDLTTKNITASVSKVNGSADYDPTDNLASLSTIVASQIVPKKVVFEEGTGTWCQWCPRGMVALDKVNADHPNDQISIAIHSGSSTEPMRDAAYSAGAAFSSYPGMNVDRELKGVDISPETIGQHVVTRKAIPTPVLLGGEYTIDGSSLKANVSAQFFTNYSAANYRLAAVVLEDGVKGTGTGYRQSNAYANGANGPMGGYESLPSTIPAAQMVYNHVGRAALGGYNGQENSVPTVIADQQTVNYTFMYTIPEKYNYTTNAANDVIPVPDNMHVVLLLIDQNDGTIVNAAKLTKGELAVNDVSLSKLTTIYPNPAKSDFNIKFDKDGSYNIVIYDMSGKVVKNYGTKTSSSRVLNLPINNLLPGKYFVNISQNGVSLTKDLLVK